MTTAKEDEKAYAAFNEYRLAKLQADRSLQFRDAENAAAAWVRYINTRLPADHKLVPLHRRTVQ